MSDLNLVTRTTETLIFLSANGSARPRHRAAETGESLERGQMDVAKADARVGAGERGLF